MPNCEEFDFDLMAKLAKEDPVEFARRREVLIRSAIENFRSPEKARKIQFDIDLERMRTPPGEQTCLAMAKAMNALLAQMAELFAGINSIAAQSLVCNKELKSAKASLPEPR